MNAQEAFARIEGDLHDHPDLARACKAALVFLQKQPMPALQRISFGLIEKAAGLRKIEDALPVADYLSGGRLHILDKQYVLIVEDEEFEISLEEVGEAFRENKLGHPSSGELVEDFQSHLFLSFTLSAEGREIVGAGK